MIGATLGHYRIVEAIGSGGMGDVYAAEDTRLKRLVALKVLQAVVAHDSERRERFEREAQVIAALNHPNIVTVHSIELEGDVPFLTMELVEGKTLAELIPRGGFVVGKLLPIAIALADALAAAHHRGVVHRDLKPANIMLTSDGRVKVLDFGLARLKEETLAAVGLTMMPTKPITGEGRIVGTVAYMAPEQAEGKRVDERSDIFSLGVVLFEMATGEKPFKGDTSLSILSSIIKDTPASVTDLNRAMPVPLGRIVRRCLAKEPLRRYQSAVDLKSDLEDLKQDLDSGVSMMSGAAAAGARGSRAAILWRAVAASLVAVLVVAGLWYAVSHRDRAASANRSSSSPVAGPMSRRVAVAVFENRTGDHSLDSLGSTIAERLIQALTEVRLAEIVPTPVPGADSRTQADVFVTGTYDAQGDTLTLQGKVLQAASGKLLHALEPISAARGDPQAAFLPLRQRVTGAVAMQVNEYFDPSLLSSFPTYDAYREWVSAVELFGADYPRTIRHLERALELDPSFVLPRLFLAPSFGNQGQWAEALAALAPVVDRSDRLSLFEREFADLFDAEIHGHRTQALHAGLELQSLAPRNYIINYQVGLIFARLNRPAEALATYTKLPDPPWITRVGTGGWRFNVAAGARHALQDFGGELRDAHDAERIAPQSLTYRGVEARALIGLGRTADALRVVDGGLALPGSAGGMMLAVARELRAHGYRQASLDLASRTVTWYRNRSPDIASSEAIRADLGRALYVAERWDEAREAFDLLARQFPENVDYQGYLGTLAARRRDRAEAIRRSEALRSVERPYLFGSHTIWRGRIAAQLHEETNAVDLLRDAFAQGALFTVETHRDMDLEPLAINAAFRELMRPK